jgi:hypothetical protein
VSGDGVALLWLPLGAGGRSVALNGRVFEWVSAHAQGRSPAPLFHSALQVRLGGVDFVVEMAPVWQPGAAERGVVRTGPVGARVLGRLDLFRYEVRRWRDGRIPDAEAAVGGPVPMSADHDRARRLLALVPSVPALTWGRDELGLGEMWNSNSLTSWLLAGSGHDLSTTCPPGGGRAPGWRAGLVLAEGRKA